MKERVNMGKFYRASAALALTIFLCPLFSFFSGVSFAAAPSDKQEALALEYRLKISRVSAPAEREALHLRLIDECPATELAEESHWLLSNLYLDDFAEPKEDEAKEILESFLKRYPKSRWASHVKSRLQWLNGESAPVTQK